MKESKVGMRPLAARMAMKRVMIAVICALAHVSLVLGAQTPARAQKETIDRMKALKGAEGVAFAKKVLKATPATNDVLRVAACERIARDTRTDFGQWLDCYQARYVAQVPESELNAMRDDYLGALAELVRRRPKAISYRLDYGSALLFQKRTKDALQQYEAAVKIADARPYDKAAAYWGVANCLFALGRKDEMVARLEECLALKLEIRSFRGWTDYLGYMRTTLRFLRGEELDAGRLPLYTGAKAFPEAQKATYSETFRPLSAVKLELKGLKPDDARVRLLGKKYARMGIRVGRTAGYPVKVTIDKSFLSNPGLKGAPNLDEAYALKVGAKGATIEAAGPQGALWGIVSLIQVTDPAKKAVRECDILDWPSVAKRGYLGSWWGGCTEYTLFQKMNSVDHQRNPTFDNQFRPLNEFLMGELARQFRSFGLELFYGCCWITHAGQLPICKERTLPFRVETFKRYAKYGAGVYYPLDDVRFPVLKEDLAKYGSARAIDAKHVSEIFRAVRKEYPDFRMVFCPPFYWGPDGRARYPEGRDPYLKSLAEELDPAIEVYWTGPRVKSYKFEPYQIDWYTKLIGRKPYLFQNGIGWHNLLHYTVDEIDWPKMYFDGCLTDGLAAYHLNAHTPGDCPRIASLADALWNIPAFNAERGVKRGVQQIMGEKAYDLLAPGEPAHYYFDKWRYGAADDRVLDEDFDELERKLATIETCWSNELAYARANGYPIYGDYGRGVDFARKIVGYARNPPNLAKKFRVLVSDAKELATREAKLDEKAGDIFRSPADMSGGRVFCLKRNPADADERGTLVRGLRPAGSKLAAVTFSFECDPFPPEGDYRLVLSLQGEPGSLRVSVNGTTVSESNSGISRTFSRKEFTLPVSALKRGNTVKIENLAPGKDEGQGTVLVAYAVLKRH